MSVFAVHHGRDAPVAVHAGFAGLVLARTGGAVPGGERAVVTDIHRQIGIAPLAHGLGRVRVQVHLAVVIGHVDTLAVEA